MSELAIVSLPRLDLTRPLMAPAILSSLAKQINMSHTVHDFALELFEIAPRADWSEYELFWQIDLQYELDDDREKKLNKIFQTFAENVLSQKPKWIAISVFTHNSINATNLFLEKLRTKTDAKIIIGGQGIQSRIYSKETYADYLLNKGLIDFYCAGEAETTFKKVLNGETQAPGINNFGWKQLDDLDQVPIPDYGKFKMDKYHHLSSGKSLYIQGSRGCVRRCDFCDIGKIWKKFRFQSGKRLADEIKQQMQNFDIKSFQFSDALINGSMKAFNDMTKNISSYVAGGEIEKPKLGGHFIVRPSHQMKPSDYENAGKAGLDEISIGVETGSDDLRFRMNKKFTNDDLAYHLDQCKKNKIKNVFLLFAGHPTETLDDHEKTLAMLGKFRYFVASGTISGLDVNHASILEDTPLSHWAYENNMIFHQDHLKGDNKFWYNPNNKDLTLKERIRRQLEVYETAIELGYPVSNIADTLKYMKTLLVTAKKKNYQY